MCVKLTTFVSDGKSYRKENGRAPQKRSTPEMHAEGVSMQNLPLCCVLHLIIVWDLDSFQKKMFGNSWQTQDVRHTVHG